MENKLAQEYKDDLYNKVLEKRNIRNKRRKQCLTFCIVFIMFIGITGLGFSKFKKEDYKNFFKSETENIMLNDEYEYFDDLGIKLEFINVDKNSITLGINIKYENIADYDMDLKNIKILENNRLIVDSENKISEISDFEKMFKDKEIEQRNQCVFIVKFVLRDDVICNNIDINIGEIVINDEKSIINKEINYKKSIEI